MSKELSVRAFEAEAAVRVLLAQNDLPLPDEIEQDLVNEEIVLLWHERKLAVVIDLGDAGVDDPAVVDAAGYASEAH